MQKQINPKPSKCLKMLCPLLFISLLTMLIFSSNASYPTFKCPCHFTLFPSYPDRSLANPSEISLTTAPFRKNHRPQSLSKISDRVLGIALSLDKLADSVSGFYLNSPVSRNNETSNVEEDLIEPEETEDEEGLVHGKVFNSAELKIYTSPKPNRIGGKKNFLGLEAMNPSIELGCARMGRIVDHYMTYKVHGPCLDDWDLAQKLILDGCEPLLKRRCFTKSPQHFTKPLSTNFTIWTHPSDANILWSHYKCQNYPCLVSNNTRGFYKCSDCFNPSKKGWESPISESILAEFTIDEVLALKPSKIRIGLDFSPTTGHFAAMMRAKNVTVASATLNLGTPFNEMIALRGLISHYILDTNTVYCS